MKYNLQKPEGQRVVELKVICSECDVPEFVPLDNDKLYDIVLSNFLLTGGDGYKMIRDYAIQKHVVGEAIQTLKLATLYHERVIHYRLLTEYPKILWPSEVVVKWNEFASSSAQRPKASIFLIDHSKHFFFLIICELLTMEPHIHLHCQQKTEFLRPLYH